MDGVIIASIVHDAWCAKLSANGYMDQTDLSIHKTRRDAEVYLVETFDDGEE